MVVDPNTLHIIRLDVLLYALGGFAGADPHQPARINALPYEYVRGLKAIAARPHAKYREVTDYAERFGQSPGSARGYITRFRRNPAFFHCWTDL